MDGLEDEMPNFLGEDEDESTEGSESSEEANADTSEQAEKVVDEESSDYEDVIGLTKEDVMAKMFRTEEAAYEFYKRYGKCHGFAVRKADFGKDDSDRRIRRRFFCNRAGLRDRKHYNRVDRHREHKPETRTNCQALLSICLDRDCNVWRVKKVVMEHNHDLTPAGMVHLISNFRSMTDSTKAQIDGMQGHGLPTSKILGYMAGQAGGYAYVGFSKKDAYNYVYKSKRARILDEDAHAAIGYLEGKANSDPMATARYLLTKENMLADLLWADGGAG